MYNYYQFLKDKKNHISADKTEIKQEKVNLEHQLHNEDLNYNHNIRLKEFLHQIWKSPIIVGSTKIEKKPKEEKPKGVQSIVSLLKFKIDDIKKKTNKLDKLPESVKFVDDYYKKELDKIKEDKIKQERERLERKNKKDEDLLINPVSGNEFFGSITKTINNQVISTRNPMINKKKDKKPKFIKSMDLSNTNTNYHSNKTYFQAIKTLACSTTDLQDRINIEKFKNQKLLKNNQNTSIPQANKRKRSSTLSQHNLKRISFYSENYIPTNKNFNYKQNHEVENFISDLKSSVPEITKINPALLDLKVDYYDDVNTAYMNDYDKEKFSSSNLAQLKKLFSTERMSYYDKLFKSKALKSNNPFSSMLKTDPKKYFKVFSVMEAKPSNKGNDTLEIDGKKYNYTEIKQISKKLLKICRVIE